MKLHYIILCVAIGFVVGVFSATATSVLAGSDWLDRYFMTEPTPPVINDQWIQRYNEYNNSAALRELLLQQERHRNPC